MRIFKNVLLILSAALLAGCASSRIVNLTPGKARRNADGLYPVEAAWTSRDATIRMETLAPKVVVGLETYPMRPVPVVRNRWETVIPVPAGEPFARYYFKFDYDYNSIPVPRPNSKRSPEYKLEILDK